MPDQLDRRAGRTLLNWYDRHQRDLPWRRRRDPYAVWVSEIMLQQTTVAAVMARYERFLERFPDVGTLAAAPLDEVLAELQGLGYYRRFRAMKRAAEMVADEHAGELPADKHGWLQLPGIGDYTAGAIASIAFDEPVPAVDGNVIRVVTRLLALPGIHESPRAKRALGEIVLGMMPRGTASQFNQALFDLGATVCVPIDPRCDECPLARRCVARAQGDVRRYPEKAPKKKMVDIDVAVALIERDGAFLMTTRPADAARMPGFRELPEVWLKSGDSASAALKKLLETGLGASASLGGELLTRRHTITHHRLTCTLYQVDLRQSGDGAGQWVRPEDIDEAATSTITRKLIQGLLKTRKTGA